MSIYIVASCLESFFFSLVICYVTWSVGKGLYISFDAPFRPTTYSRLVIQPIFLGTASFIPETYLVPIKKEKEISLTR